MVDGDRQDDRQSAHAALEAVLRDGRTEARKTVRRLVILGLVVGVPFGLLAAAADDPGTLGVLAAMAVVVAAFPAYAILIGGPNHWKKTVHEAAAPLILSESAFDRYERGAGRMALLEPFNRLGLLPGHGSGHFEHFFSGRFDGSPAMFAEVSLVDTASHESGSRLRFRGFVFRLTLPRPSAFTAHIGPRRGWLRRRLSGIPGDLKPVDMRPKIRNSGFCVYADAPDMAREHLDAGLFEVLERLGRKEGRGPDATTVVSWVIDLLSNARATRAVRAGIDGQHLLVAVDRRRALLRIPHPFVAPREADGLLARFRRELAAVEGHVRALAERMPAS